MYAKLIRNSKDQYSILERMDALDGGDFFRELQKKCKDFLNISKMDGERL